MQIKTVLLLAALSTAAFGAGATTTDWGTLGPFKTSAVMVDPAGSIDDIYTFSLTSISNITAYDKAFEAADTGITGTVTLFSGTVGMSTQVGSAQTLDGTDNTFGYSNVAVGSYYFEVMGTATGDVGVYDIHALAEPSGGPSNVPEPATGALLLAGTCILGLTAARRKRG